MTWLDRGLDVPPPGRVRVHIDEAKALLVDHERFAASTTRRPLWQGLDRYLGKITDLEQRYAEELEGSSLIVFLWLGGSFVTSKLEPANIDLSVGIDADLRDRIHRRPGTAWLKRGAFQREACLRNFGVSPLEIPYRRVASVFTSGGLPQDQQDYLRERGAWDDWWQRRRETALEDQPPSADTAVTVRGYLEVIL